MELCVARAAMQKPHFAKPKAAQYEVDKSESQTPVWDDLLLCQSGGHLLVVPTAVACPKLGAQYSWRPAFPGVEKFCCAVAFTVKPVLGT